MAQSRLYEVHCLPLNPDEPIRGGKLPDAFAETGQISRQVRAQLSVVYRLRYEIADRLAGPAGDQRQNGP